MGSLAFAALIVTGTFAVGMSFDMGINALQNWYEVVYQDAFWSHHPEANSPALQALSREEHEIDRLMRTQDFTTARETK